MDETITIIGSGNVATQLGLALQKNGFEIVQVVSRKLSNARKLAKLLNCKAFNSVENIHPTSIYLIAVNDDAIKNVALQLQVFIDSLASKKPLVIHTSGSVGLSVLDSNNYNSGILYPLQTITKNSEIDFTLVPFIYFSNVPAILKQVKLIAAKLSSNVVKLNDEQRLALHIAAVFTNNFTNHIIAKAQEICKKNEIDFALLQPLLFETFEKLRKSDASKLQTGPARRNDKLTINKHLKLLKSTDEAKIYKVLTQSIMNFYSE